MFDATLSFTSNHKIYDIDDIPIKIDTGYGSDFTHLTNYIFITYDTNIELSLELESDIDLICLICYISCDVYFNSIK